MMKLSLSTLISTACVGALGFGLAYGIPAFAEEETTTSITLKEESTPETNEEKAPEPEAEEEKPAKEAKKEGKKDAGKKEAKNKDYVILDINGDKIKFSTVMGIWSGLFPEGSAPDFSRFDEKVRQNVLRGVISEHLIYTRAKASGVENNPKVQETLNRLKTKLVSQVEKRVNEADVRAAYEKRVRDAKGKKELRARHILVDTEEEAEALIAQLEDDASFEKLAREKSEDRASAKRGGDLGYFGKGEMIPEFTERVFDMDVGDVSEEPLKTEFGWHVIKLEDKRDVKVRPYDEVKDGIREELKAKALQDYVHDLVDSANVKYYSRDGEEQEFTKTPDSTKGTP